jgi:hypothetical protein
MKLLTIAAASACLCLSISSISLYAQSTKGKSSKMPVQSPPFTALYSSKFEIGDPALSMQVLNAWKMYDDNTFDQGPLDFIADTVHAEMGGGMVVNGKDSFVSAIKSYRSSLPSAKSTVIAYASLKSTDKNETVVAIWGSEADGQSDGSTKTVDLHEVWVFNAARKLVFFKQFIGHSSM